MGKVNKMPRGGAVITWGKITIVGESLSGCEATFNKILERHGKPEEYNRNDEGDEGENLDLSGDLEEDSDENIEGDIPDDSLIAELQKEDNVPWMDKLKNGGHEDE